MPSKTTRRKSPALPQPNSPDIKTPESVIVALVSDSHGGSKYGLLSPATTLTDLDDGLTPYTPELNRLQERLWEWYTADMARVMALADGRPVVLVHLGDPTQGNKYPQNLVSESPADQVAIGVANMAPWLEYDNVRWVRLIAGTGSHEFGNGASTALIGQQLAAKWPRLNLLAGYHALLTVGGVVLDLSHHGPGGGIRNWLYGNMMRLYIRSLMLDDIVAGGVPPRVVARGHTHVAIRELVNVGDHSTWGLTVPSWQYPYEWVRQRAQSPARVTFGMVALEIESGALRGMPHEFKRTIDHRTKEVI